MKMRFIQHLIVFSSICLFSLVRAQSDTASAEVANVSTPTAPTTTSAYVVGRVSVKAIPNTNAAEIANYLNGDKINIFEYYAGWARVQTINGDFGWVQTLNTSASAMKNKQWKSLELEVRFMRKEFYKMKKDIQKIDPLQQRNNALKQTNKNLQSQIDEIKKQYEFSLRVEGQNNKLQKNNEQLNTQLNILENKMLELRAGNKTTYYFHGALIMLMGMILAWIAPRLAPKRRRGSWD